MKAIVNNQTRKEEAELKDCVNVSRDILNELIGRDDSAAESKGATIEERNLISDMENLPSNKLEELAAKLDRLKEIFDTRNVIVSEKARPLWEQLKITELDDRFLVKITPDEKLAQQYLAKDLAALRVETDYYVENSASMQYTPKPETLVFFKQQGDYQENSALLKEHGFSSSGSGDTEFLFVVAALLGKELSKENPLSSEERKVLNLFKEARVCWANTCSGLYINGSTGRISTFDVRHSLMHLPGTPACYLKSLSETNQVQALSSI